MACRHVDAAELRAPTQADSVYREDCTQCFDSIDDSTGLDVCLYCFNGGCTSERNHSRLHYQRSKHPLVLNIRRSRKKIKREEPPPKISKLAIAAETDEDRYDTTTSIKCYDCDIADVPKSPSEKLSHVVDEVLRANTFARKAEVQAWEEEITPCEHTLCLEQGPSRKIESQDLGHCYLCDLKENLWLCLSCGNLGCGRAQYGGTGGNGHGLQHFEESQHPVAIKLGSITPEGTVDAYCYTCNDERSDPEIAKHLAHWDINIAERQKTEKSLTEMQIEQNLRWDFAMTTKEGKELQPIFGPGFTGLKNLGNSCYLASILQCLFSTTAFADRYYKPSDVPPDVSKPAEDLETQLRKMADGLLSGRYSKPDPDFHASQRSPSSEVAYQRGLVPSMLKHLIGRGHEEFSTMRQQDAFELLLHLFKQINMSPHQSQPDPVQSFRFVMEQRLQCLNCRKVRYRSDEQDNISIAVPVRRKTKPQVEMSTEAEGDKAGKDEFEPVTLKDCLDNFTAPEQVDLTCPSCGSKGGFTKQTLFKTFPETLAVNARRFELVNWIPTKLDVPVVVPEESFALDPYQSKGHQESEELLPEDTDPAGSPTGFVPNELALAQLEAMGFPRVRCEKALHATGNSDAEAAMNWLIGHMDDPDIDAPTDFGKGGSAARASNGGSAVSAEKVETMGAMGIAAPQARKALKETGGDVTRAIDWVFSHPDDQGDFGDNDEGSKNDTSTVNRTAPTEKPLAGSASLPAHFRLQSIACHKGASIHTGHYVAFIRKPLPNGEEAWVLFNDEKVAKAEDDVDEMKKFAYVYFFRRASSPSSA